MQKKLEMDQTASSAPRSLIEHVEKTVCSALNINSTRHRSAIGCLRRPVDPNLVEGIFQTMADNYKRGDAAARNDRSHENWRWPELQLQIAEQNRSPEVKLERAIAAACASLGNTDWSNQVPVASGLIAGTSGGRRAIDLVHKCGEGHFELIELKICSDTPLYAAVEIMSYGCLWLLARKFPPAKGSAILKADHVDLRVLAPSCYYARYKLTNLREFEEAMDDGCRALGRTQGNAIMTFAFQALDELPVNSLPVDDQALLTAVANRISWRDTGRE